jgi:putative SOS response-associated peptidase YedK
MEWQAASIAELCRGIARADRWTGATVITGQFDLSAAVRALSWSMPATFTPRSTMRTFATSHINARAETVHKLPLFREAFAKHRCLIPATGFYEWQKRDDGKQPYRFRRRDLEPFAFAGVWEFTRLGGEDILSTAMIVREANPLVGGVHDRMPVMLMSEDDDRWLGTTTDIDELKVMLKPYDSALMEA